ncbi:TetR/AcrR family transcriptional regulator [Phytoactinopolyspora limicola]|uniref:TetR/AcrR family transcriptional regulator n=1 Tax=Phytoactinopolyspora limicola TaxID=2715536 RepID=UPI001407F6C6|nr:TetR/AcrR family transcriptional regulator [Phytoactinopolyspora limicola]
MSAESAAPTVVDLLWKPRRPPRRGPRPALTLERITQVGIDIADAEGLSAVSMQRVAEGLGFTKMSLYRYVPGKAELVALMADAAMGQPDLGAFDSWRPQLREWSTQLWSAFAQHPWVLGVTVGRRPLGPNELAWLDAGLAALADTGLSGGEKFDTVALLTGHVRSLAEQTVAVPEGHSGASEQDVMDELAAVLGEHGARYPAVLAAMSSAQAGREQALGFGIDRILDGLAVFIERGHGH